METLNIRESEPADFDAIDSLYSEAFPDEDLLPLVKELLDGAANVLSLAAIVISSLAGHGLFTSCRITDSEAKVALLGPLAVAPSRQKQGVGSAIVGVGLQRLEQAGFERVCVLGDPAYYGRFGFEPEARIVPPYALPFVWRNAWQSRGLGTAGPSSSGTLSVPEPWLRPALWAP